MYETRQSMEADVDASLAESGGSNLAFPRRHDRIGLAMDQ